MSEKIDIVGLQNLDAILSLPKSGTRTCVIEDIIQEFPETHIAQVREILENKNGYNATQALKILRQTNIKNGSVGSIGKHRRQSCACYI